MDYGLALVDERNEKLWIEINNTYTVSFAESVDGGYGCFSENNEVTFFVNSSNLCKDSFTHEMLHIYLRMKDCFIGAGLKRTVGQSKILSFAMSPSLIEHIGNCLDHVKMLPIYLEMGFDRTKFISDYEMCKCDLSELKNLKTKYKIGKLVNPQAFDYYCGKLFSILCDPNERIDYSFQLSELKKLDLLLFNTVHKMIEQWKSVKIEGREVFDDDYNSVLGQYYGNMKKWISNNQINK